MKVIKGIFCQCLILVMWIGLTQAAGEAQTQTAPVLEVEGTIYDFHQVTEGEVVKHDFRVFNRGDAPLEIKSVRPG
jgi:hypothetical protein